MDVTKQPRLHSRRQQIERIKAEADYKLLYYVEIRDSETEADAEGWITGGDCPLSTDCQGNQFEVNVKTGRCRCRSCGSETDALGFIMQRHFIPFPDALRFLKSGGEK